MLRAPWMSRPHLEHVATLGRCQEVLRNFLLPRVDAHVGGPHAQHDPLARDDVDIATLRRVLDGEELVSPVGLLFHFEIGVHERARQDVGLEAEAMIVHRAASRHAR